MPIRLPTAVDDGSARYASRMRARSTRLAGSVRDRANVSRTARSSAPIDNSTTRRAAAMIATCIDDQMHYKPRRDRGNPWQTVTFTESMH
jgi:hypothetical protein